jgi:hypothetical protein
MSIYVMPEAPDKLPEPPAGSLVMAIKIELVEDNPPTQTDKEESGE